MFDNALNSEADLREIIPEPLPRAWHKEVSQLDAHCREFIAASPIFMLATSDLEGRCDCSPRGGPPGFVTVLDDRHLAIADYTGNRRADSHRNILANPQVGLLFLLPGMDETLRLNGTAVLTRDPAVLGRLNAGGKPPRLALGITLETAFLQCAKALKRAELWSPGTWPDAEELPSAAKILRDHVGAAGERSVEQIQQDLDVSYSERLW